MSTLFDPLKLGSIILAPLTRSRAGDERIANDLMAEYCGQRASAFHSGCLFSLLQTSLGGFRKIFRSIHQTLRRCILKEQRGTRTIRSTRDSF